MAGFFPAITLSLLKFSTAAGSAYTLRTVLATDYDYGRGASMLPFRGRTHP